MACSKMDISTRYNIYDTTQCIDVKRDRTYVISGITEGGKSIILLDMISRGMYRVDKEGKPDPRWSRIFFLSPTVNLQNTFNGLPNEFKFTDPSEYLGIIEKVLKVQGDRIKKYGKHNVPSVLIVIDDCLGKIPRSDLIDEMVSSGRHYNTTCIILTQNIKSKFTPPCLRENMVYAIMGVGTEKKEVMRLIPGGTNREKEDYIDRAWNEPYRYIIYNKSPDIGCGRLFLLQVDMKKLIKKFRVVLN